MEIKYIWIVRWFYNFCCLVKEKHLFLQLYSSFNLWHSIPAKDIEESTKERSISWTGEVEYIIFSYDNCKVCLGLGLGWVEFFCRTETVGYCRFPRELVTWQK